MVECCGGSRELNLPGKYSVVPFLQVGTDFESHISSRPTEEGVDGEEHHELG